MPSVICLILSRNWSSESVLSVSAVARSELFIIPSTRRLITSGVGLSTIPAHGQIACRTISEQRWSIFPMPRGGRRRPVLRAPDRLSPLATPTLAHSPLATRQTRGSAVCRVSNALRLLEAGDSLL